jgi:hypothetical protein
MLQEIRLNFVRRDKGASELRSIDALSSNFKEVRLGSDASWLTSLMLLLLTDKDSRFVKEARGLMSLKLL